MTTIHIRFGSGRKPYNPKPGDLRMRKGVLQVRCYTMAKNGTGQVIGYNCTGGRQNYHWEDVKPEDLPKQLKKYEEKQT